MGRLSRWFGTSGKGLLIGCVVAGSFGLTKSSLAQDDAPPADTDEADITAQALLDEEQRRSEQAALDSELASAKRFEVELEALLLPDGQLNAAQDDAFAKLRSLATRCGILANSAMHDEVRLVLLGYQARALAALASLEPAGQGNNPGWVEQLNDTAQQIAAVDLPGAMAMADYWLLIGETQQGLSKKPLSQRQPYVEKVLNLFIEKHAQDPDAIEYLLDTRLSLAQLLDQRGAQREVKKQLDQLGKLPADSPRLSDVKRLRDSIARLGKPIAFDSISTQLTRWRSSDHLGKPVLIHVYADGVEPSVRMIDVISRSIVEGSLSGIAVVSLRVGEPVAGTVAPPWPTLPVSLEPDGVLDLLGVTALPTLAWLDEEGKLASIGTTAAVLDQLNAILPAEPDEAADDAGPAIESAPEPQPAPDQKPEQAPAVDEPAENQEAGVDSAPF